MKSPLVGMRVRIKPNSTLFPGEEAVVAYIGVDGISVYLVNEAKFDECVSLNNDEWEPLTRIARDVLGLVIGEGASGIPGGLAEYDVRVRWLHDRRGNQQILSCRCTTCGTRRSLLFPVRRMAIHVESAHR